MHGCHKLCRVLSPFIVTNLQIGEVATKCGQAPVGGQQYFVNVYSTEVVPFVALLRKFHESLTSHLLLCVNYWPAMCCNCVV